MATPARTGLIYPVKRNTRGWIQLFAVAMLIATVWTLSGRGSRIDPEDQSRHPSERLGSSSDLVELEGAEADPPEDYRAVAVGSEGAPPDPISDEASLCTILVSLRDGRFLGEFVPVAGVRVLAGTRRPGEREPATSSDIFEAWTDVEGKAVISVPTPSEYELWVDGQTLPDGLSGSRSFDTFSDIPGVSRVIASPACGADTAEPISITVLPKRSISGSISECEGLACRVLASATLPGLEGVFYRVPVGMSGEFLFEDVLPLSYVLHLECSGEGSAFLPPQFVNVEQASSYGVTIDGGPGSGVVRGRIYDEQGLPLEAIDVLAYFCRGKGPDLLGAPSNYRFTWSDVAGRAMSSSDGTFEIGGLHEGLVCIIAGIKASSNDPAKGGRVWKSSTRIEVFISKSTRGPIQITDIILERR